MGRSNQKSGDTFSGASVHSLIARGAIIGLCLALAGCKARLDLSGVEAQTAKPVQRFDLFQAAARFQGSVVVAGAMGVVVHSADGGKTWQRTVLPGKPFLVDVVACPDGSFHAVEKTDGLWNREASGEWTRQELPEMTEPQAMTCDRANTLWVTGGFSSILHTADAGANWETWSLEEDLFLTTIQFVDEQHGFATGEFGTVLGTSDGGLTWERAADLPDSFYPQSAWFSDPSTGWAVGLDGIIWKTGDAAVTWQLVPSGINSPLYGIAASGDTLLAVGDNTTILHAGADSEAWQRLDAAEASHSWLRAVTALGGNEFVVAGGGNLFTVTVPGGGSPVGEGAASE